MEIYVEDAIITNFVMDYFIVKFTAILLHKNYSKLKILIVVSISTVIACILPMLNLNSTYLTLLKICIGFFITTILDYPVKKLNNYFKTTFIFFLSTFIFGGCIYAAEQVFEIKLNPQNNLGSLPILFISFVFAKNCIYYLKKIKRKNKQTNYLKSVKLILREQEYSLIGYVDTGNFLIDENCNLPVFILEFSSVAKEFSCEEIGAIIAGNLSDIGLKNAHFKNISSVETSSKMIIFEPNKIFIDNNETKAMVGFTYKKLSKNNEFTMLLSASVL